MVHIVWFKRDLRVTDHQPLTHAIEAGSVLPIYIIEPSLIHAPDYDRRHYDFTRDCLLELRENLASRGQTLIVRVGEVLDVFDAICRITPIDAIHAHEETGTMLSYERDISVHLWCKAHDIPFYETPNNGVIRPLKDRDNRRKLWQAQMKGDPLPAPKHIPPVAVDIPIGEIPTWDTLGIHDEGIVARQIGGESEAQKVLNQFLFERGSHYHREMSSPVTAEDSCSRISPHLAYGSISLRQVFRALQKRRNAIYDMSDSEYRELGGSWKSAFRSFNSRLHWHDHFIQKLEDEPRIEYESFVPQYDALRDEPTTDDDACQRFEAYKAGKTGYPMVDASIRYLRATGWINFRMRAMLVSFASYDLWIQWQHTAEFLARLFTDYEPGIHYSQVQMQSGTTGINTLRVYNPIKQGIDHDPDGVFIRAWVPELRNVLDEHIHEPFNMPPMTEIEADCVIGEDYPTPIVKHKEAVKEAKNKVWALRKRDDVKAEAEKVVKRHASRKNH
ncbi:MAG: deoxyribodipyrimidine photo-lyase [Chloroflexota bacterium]